ncbi:hypothetical protein cyc_06177 [Cyclospora cayetanensis]|uniref:Uncharacterized protein n=1 Tax=Cyclospora cayetanensis TaxID=88456 RepID=A0A1D3D7F6_9EIME|nr:hypothetical protein cyc_06177 [Cyclospora cayetanensis]
MRAVTPSGLVSPPSHRSLLLLPPQQAYTSLQPQAPEDEFLPASLLPDCLQMLGIFRHQIQVQQQPHRDPLLRAKKQINSEEGGIRELRLAERLCGLLDPEGSGKVHRGRLFQFLAEILSECRSDHSRSTSFCCNGQCSRNSNRSCSNWCPQIAAAAKELERLGIVDRRGDVSQVTAALKDAQFQQVRNTVADITAVATVARSLCLAAAATVKGATAAREAQHVYAELQSLHRGFLPLLLNRQRSCFFRHNRLHASEQLITLPATHCTSAAAKEVINERGCQWQARKELMQHHEVQPRESSVSHDECGAAEAPLTGTRKPPSASRKEAFKVTLGSVACLSRSSRTEGPRPLGFTAAIERLRKGAADRAHLFQFYQNRSVEPAPPLLKHAGAFSFSEGRYALRLAPEVFGVSVEIQKGRHSRISIREGENPREAVRSFCRSYGLHAEEQQWLDSIILKEMAARNLLIFVEGDKPGDKKPQAARIKEGEIPGKQETSHNPRRNCRSDGAKEAPLQPFRVSKESSTATEMNQANAAPTRRLEPNYKGANVKRGASVDRERFQVHMSPSSSRDDVSCAKLEKTLSQPMESLVVPIIKDDSGTPPQVPQIQENDTLTFPLAASTVAAGENVEALLPDLSMSQQQQVKAHQIMTQEHQQAAMALHVQQPQENETPTILDEELQQQQQQLWLPSLPRARKALLPPICLAVGEHIPLLQPQPQSHRDRILSPREQCRVHDQEQQQQVTGSSGGVRSLPCLPLFNPETEEATTAAAHSYSTTLSACVLAESGAKATIWRAGSPLIVQPLGDR